MKRPFFYPFPAAQKTSFRRPVPRLQAQLGPARPSPSLSHRQAGPARRDLLPSPSEPDSRSNPTEISALPCPLGPAHPGTSPAPIKGTLDPLEIPSPKPQPPSSRTLACAAIAAPELGAPRRAAAPLRLLDDITAPKLRVEVRELSSSVFPSPSRSVRPL